MELVSFSLALTIAFEMSQRLFSGDGNIPISPMMAPLSPKSSSQSPNVPAFDPNSGYQHLHSSNLSKFPLAALPHSPIPKSGSLKLSMLSSLMGKRRKKMPNTHDLSQALDKLSKLSKKTLKQQQNVLNLFKDWGTGLPDSASRELVMNLFNMLLGPLSISTDLSTKLAGIGSQLDELSLMEDHRTHLESELVNTQKLYYRASYKGYPNYQLQSYQLSYDNFRNDFDEITLRYRNKLVMVLKQSLHLIFASMHDQSESEMECSSLGFRLLAGFDSEPKHVVQSSIYQPLQYYTPLLAPALDGTPSPQIFEDKTCIQCHQAMTETEEPEVRPRADRKHSNELKEFDRPAKNSQMSPGEARFARLSPRLSHEMTQNSDPNNSRENTLARGKQSSRSLLSSAFSNNFKGRRESTQERNPYASTSTRPLSNASIISPNPFT